MNARKQVRKHEFLLGGPSNGREAEMRACLGAGEEFGRARAGGLVRVGGEGKRRLGRLFGVGW